jgi:transglutaminase-like putative cysteine protease
MSITDGLSTTYDRAAAVQSWLQVHTEYDLGIPPDPEGVDAVDHFLFETRRGFCEHIASAMVLLLRAAGVPARFVVGFGPGDRNPLTGYFDVRESDAHAWVEVVYPGIGWMPYDPTFGVPNANPSAASRFIAPEVFRAVGRWLSTAIPQPVREAASSTLHALGRNPLPLVAAIALVLMAALLRSARRRRRGRPIPPVGAAAAFAVLAEALAATGRTRPAHRTPSEFLSEVVADPGLPEELVDKARTVVRTFERERFSAAGVSAEEVAASTAAAGRARDLAAAAPRAGAPR